MASEPDQDLVAQAVAWYLRLKDGTAAEWRDFVEWLEADPARSEAYDRVEGANATLMAGAFDPAVSLDAFIVKDDGPEGAGSPRRWLMGLTAGISASVSVLAGTSFVASRPDLYEAVSAPGEQRRVDIGDGSYALLSGRTRLILDRNDPRGVELVSGKAAFTVGGGSDRPFTVTSGRHNVQGLGTIFNVINESDTFFVEVVKGTVVYDPDAAAVSLSEGQGLRASDSGSPDVFRIDAQAIEGWRRGHLSYTDAPVSVTNDLSRTLGVATSPEACVARQPFTGSAQIERDAATTIAGLALAANIQAPRAPDGWAIEPATRASR